MNISIMLSLCYIGVTVFNCLYIYSINKITKNFLEFIKYQDGINQTFQEHIDFLRKENEELRKAVSKVLQVGPV